MEWLIDHWPYLTGTITAIGALIAAARRTGASGAIFAFMRNRFNLELQNFHLRREVYFLNSYITKIERILEANGISVHGNDSDTGSE